MNNCRRAASLTRQLLAFSRKQTLSPQPLDLGQLICNSGRLLKPLIGEHIDLQNRTSTRTCTPSRPTRCRWSRCS